MLLIAALCCAPQSTEPLTGRIIPGLLLGLLLFPPNRHRSREAYRGTMWPVWLGVILVIATTLGQFACGVVLGLMSAAVRASPESVQMLNPVILVVASMSTAAVAGVAILILKLRGGAWWGLGLTSWGFWSCLWLGTQAGLAIMAIKLLWFKYSQTLDLWQLAGFGVGQAFFTVEDVATGALMMLVVAVVVPVCEEILFRGVLFAALRRRSGPVAAVILSSLIFGVCHYPDFKFPFGLGVAFALLYHCTGSLFAPIAAHVLVNGSTVALAFDHGQLTANLSWLTVGLILLAASAAQFLAIFAPPTPVPSTCPCGQSRPDLVGRCPECGFPFRRWPRWVGALLSSFSGLMLVVVTATALGVAWLAEQRYQPAWTDSVQAFHFRVLRSTGRTEAASRHLKDWVTDRPKALVPLMVASEDAYRREAYGEALKLLERISPDRNGKLPQEVNNQLACVLAEIGGNRAPEAVARAREALFDAGVEIRPHIADTLGWALLRAGKIQEARQYLDRELFTYGIVSRAGAAELQYHRGVLLWAMGDTVRARRILDVAAGTGAGGEPYSGRSARILRDGRLPAGLVPPEPPPEDEG